MKRLPIGAPGPRPTRRQWLGQGLALGTGVGGAVGVGLGAGNVLANVLANAAGSAMLVGATAWLGSGCTLAPDEDHRGPDAPRAAPLKARPRIAWVFSSGGPRGFVHVGVLKALDELKLKPDLIVGASVGALVAVLYGSGLSAAEIESLALDLGPSSLGQLAIGSSGGERFSGAPLAELVRRYSKLPLLEHLPLPVACVAAVPEHGVVAFTAGDVGLAVQASAAVEGRFTPVRIHGRRHVDADRYCPLPVREAQALGALRVLAVDASAHEDQAPESAKNYRAGDLRKRALTRPDAERADVLLHPVFGYWVSLTREFRERAIAAGYRDTLVQAARLRALHAA